MSNEADKMVVMGLGIIVTCVIVLAIFGRILPWLMKD